jgi:uncharacterized protein (DUF697 family)
MAQDTTGSETTEHKDQLPVEQKAADAPETPEQRKEVAEKLVDRFALWSGAAGLIPVPFLDAVAVGALQLELLRRLAKIYEVPFTDVRAKSLIASTIGSVVPASAGLGISSAVKSVPVLGTAIGIVATPAFAAGATCLVGKTFIEHFASGGTLLDFDPAEYREFIKAHKAKMDAAAASGASGATTSA